MNSPIRVVGARVHNLKNISAEIPRGRLVVLTGLSGSGKSSLAFDTIYAEGQRRYMESLSSYARQFLGNIEKPDVDYIEGLSPAIAIDQKSAARSPRSTVGTMSEVYDYLRLLFARVGQPHCPTCGKQLRKQRIVVPAGQPDQPSKPIEKQLYTCFDCDLTLPEINLGSFSFNSPEGACPVCHGLGIRLVIDPDLVLPNPRLTLAEGAIRPWARTTAQSASYARALNDFCTRHQVSMDVPVGRLPAAVRTELLVGDSNGFEGVIPNLERRYSETDSDYLKREIEKYMVEQTCDSCHGQRLRPEVLGIRIAKKNIVDIVQLTITDAQRFFAKDVPVEPGYETVAEPIIRELRRRLTYLQEVGLSYLTIDRNADTLAGGEAQRIRLATQLGAQLAGVVYILDEPSIGLHPRDQHRLMGVLESLRDLGNTVIVVEHDEQTIRKADWVIDVGPGAGERGGRIIAAGKPEDLMKNTESITGQYLAGTLAIPIPVKRRKPTAQVLTIHGARAFNLKNIDVTLPLGLLLCVTGVSGSGKSTLVQDVLAKALAKRFYRAKAEPGEHTAITGIEHIDKVIAIDQSPIGRTPRSNPATYVNFFSLIRDLYVQQPEAKKRRLSAGHFSFNVRGGRCERCRGEGSIKVEMHFLPDVYVTCVDCNGARYKPDVLGIAYRDKSIADVLAMTVEEAATFFADQPPIAAKLQVLVAVGLGYLKLGQPATTLSGGEAQRVKLATELSRTSTGRTLYILDEPTTGLHFEDIRRLLIVLQALVDKGNTVLVIEHNSDVIKAADWVVDLGPEGGAGGGRVVAAGTPEKIASVASSETGRYLAEVLNKEGKHATRPAKGQPKYATK